MSPRPSDPIEPETARGFYARMLGIRLFEERLFELVGEGKIGGTTHLCIGQEAVPVGVSSLLVEGDRVTSTHRGHGHLLALGADPRRLLAEIAGKESGYCRGKGGSQHVAVPELGHMGSNGITGGGLPIAAGLALAAKRLRPGRIVVAYLGDGAAATGNFHETLNLAALHRLPVVFVMENNLYAMSTPVSRFAAGDFVDWAGRYRDLEARSCDGNDLAAVREAAAPLFDRARRGDGPAFLECRTYRQSGHSKSDARVYRSREEEARWRERDPLRLWAERAGLEEAELGRIRAEIEEELEEAVREVLASPAGGLACALGDLELLPAEGGEAPGDLAEGERTTLTEAIRDVLRGEMRRDERVFLLGEDIGVYGGAFGVSRGLLEEFGTERVVETPICENSFVGLGVGAAAGGLRPVVELMFGDFATCCMDALVNHAAKLRYMYGGAVRVPFTLRMPVGRRRGYGATHSQSLEALFVHVPGLRVVMPATVEDAVGLLRTSIRSEEPVLFLEPKLLYPEEGRMPPAGHCVPLGSARLDREGGDLSLVTYGHGLMLAREAAEALAARGYSIEILDLRSLAPLDEEAVAASVEKTGRLVVVHEASGVLGIGDRVLGGLAERIFPWLHAPPVKVAGEACPIPSSPELEDLVLPSARKIVAACLPLLEEY